MMRIAAFIAFLAAVGVASATPITFTTTGLGDNVDVSYVDGAGAGGHNGYAGELRFFDGSETFSTLCVDLRATIGGGASWNAPISVLTPADGNYFLAGSIMAANVGLISTGQEWAALQLAVWEAVYDGNSGDFANGSFRLNGAQPAVSPLAQSYFFNRDPGATVLLYDVERNIGGQYVGGQPQIRVVPEPATCVALGCGVLALLRRRRLR